MDAKVRTARAPRSRASRSSAPREQTRHAPALVVPVHVEHVEKVRALEAAKAHEGAAVPGAERALPEQALGQAARWARPARGPRVKLLGRVVARVHRVHRLVEELGRRTRVARGKRCQPKRGQRALLAHEAPPAGYAR